MGYQDACFADSDEVIIRQALGGETPTMPGITFERLLEQGWAKLPLPGGEGGFLPFAEGGCGTPSGRVALYNEGMVGEGLDPLPTYTPPKESAEADPGLAARYPLRLLSPKAHHFLNSSFANVPSLARDAGGPRVELHPVDAAARGLRDGQPVRVFNDRGGFEATLRISERVAPGVAMSPFGQWRKRGGGAVNATTGSFVTDMGAGPAFYDNQVEVAGAG
jgi:anaerobic selenocysteine-containing dehydrogenase